jgi:citrate lyase beta subunit
MPALSAAELAALTAELSAVDERRAARFPGERPGRQPVHTCYVPADAITADLPRQWGARALAVLPEPAELAEVAGLSVELAAEVRPRVAAKLAAEPVEDLRIDFEDGYRGADEDADALAAARQVSAWLAAGLAPPGLGLRIGSLDAPATRERGLRTLDLFLSELAELPPGFVVTLPKVTAREQVEVFVAVLAALEDRLGLPQIPFEIQVETAESIVDEDGRIAIPGFLAAGAGRVRGLHFGTYDYTASLGLPAAAQHLAHRACDFARHVMQVSAAGTGVWLSDGSTNILPIGSPEQVRHGWRTHAGLVRRALEHGYYQGWDLHPHQLVTRYATVHAHYRTALPEVLPRLSAYLDGTAGSVADEPATAHALAGVVRRALACSAATPAEVEEFVAPADLDRL